MPHFYLKWKHGSNPDWQDIQADNSWETICSKIIKTGFSWEMPISAFALTAVPFTDCAISGSHSQCADMGYHHALTHSFLQNSLSCFHLRKLDKPVFYITGFIK